MKFVSWNIRYGGQSRADSIIDQLQQWQPDIVGLSEFSDTAPSQQISLALSWMGLEHQFDTAHFEDPKPNCLLLASREPFELQTCKGFLSESGRWIHAKLQSGMDVILIAAPIRGKSIKECKKKLFQDEFVAAIAQLDGSPSIAFGDTNSGLPNVDEEGSYFNRRESDWFAEIAKLGWSDVWRDRNPDRRDFTWHHNKSDNGFRIDQLFANRLAAPLVSEVRYDWGSGGRAAGISDHAAIVFEIDIEGQ